MVPASVYIVTLNEEKNLGRALESVKDFDDIVIVDSGSSDATLDIARKYTDHIIHNDWVTEYDQRQFSLSQCRHEWVLSLDADEEVDAELLASIKKTVQNDEADGLEIQIVEYFMGRLPHLGVKHSHRVKFFKKSKFEYGRARVHIPARVDGKVRKAKGYIIHFGEKSISLAMSKNDKYASYKAQDKFDKGKKPSLMKLIFVSPLTFMKYYVFKRQFLSGLQGFVLSVNSAHYAFLKEAKLFELYRTNEDSTDL